MLRCNAEEVLKKDAWMRIMIKLKNEMPQIQFNYFRNFVHCLVSVIYLFIYFHQPNKVSRIKCKDIVSM